MADRMILENAIKVFEKKFHCSLCLHDYSGMLDHTFLPAMHLNCFCTEVKRSATHGHIQCKCFDIITLQQHLLRVRKSFFKQCAAGAVEAVFPVMLENSVAGAVFAGVFSSLPPEKEAVLLEPGNIAAARILPDLPDDLESFIAFGELIAGYIGQYSMEQPPFPGTARDILLEFFRTRHRQNISLDDAAELLGITPARASEKIKREFGRNFAAILRGYRLKTACMLLENSSFPLEKIARRSGFSCGAYLSRVFKKEFKTTPGEWRESKKRDQF